jgi:hypothetical protein
MGNRADAEDMLQDLWLRIHRSRHAYRPGEPVLPWVYAIARCVRTDNYRRRRRIVSRESAVEVLPESSHQKDAQGGLPLEDLMTPLSERQRTFVTMLPVNEFLPLSSLFWGLLRPLDHKGSGGRHFWTAAAGTAPAAITFAPFVANP